MRVQREQPVGLHQCVRTDEEIGEQAFRAGFGRLTPAGSVTSRFSLAAAVILTRTLYQNLPPD